MSSTSYMEVVEGLADQMESANSLPLGEIPKGNFDKIVVAGVGGSSIAGGILQSYLYDNHLPVYLSRGYKLPEFVNQKTLVFVISYSGNTEETLDSVKTAYRKGATIVGITSGGKLLERLKNHRNSFIQIPAGLQPRASIAYQLIPMIRMLSAMGILSDTSEELEKTIDAIRRVSFKDRAKVLAEKLLGKVPIIYASDRYSSIAYRWKTQFNEHAKIHAFSGELPEVTHNEILGYEYPNAQYYIIILEDQEDHKRIKTRMKLIRSTAGQKDVPSTQISIKGDTTLARIFSAIHLGDLVSLQLAILSNVDPEPIEIIDNFKAELAKVPNV